MVGEVEVVAAGEEQHVATVDAHVRRLGAVEYAHAAVRATLANGAEHLFGDSLATHWGHASRRMSGFRISPSPPARRKRVFPGALASASS